VVTVYTREGCHLCDDAVSVLRRVQAEFSFLIEEVDIDGRPDLLEAYADVIPVIVVAGREVARAPVDATNLRKALRSAIVNHP
jgi:glutaredoxin